LTDQRKKIVIDDLPEKIEIDEVIAVDQSIPQSHNLEPIYMMRSLLIAVSVKGKNTSPADADEAELQAR
jgi:hypothetical protein